MQQGFAGLLKGLQGIATNPLFTAGASIYQGAPIGQAMAQAQRSQAIQQEQERENQMRQQWQQMAQSEQVPQGMAPFMQFMDPRQGASLLAQRAMTAPDRERAARMDEARLRILQQQAAQAGQGPGVRYMKSGNQIVAIGPDGAPQVVHQAPMSPMDEAKMRFLQSIMPPGAQPGADAGPVRPQSFDDGGQDPMLQRTQTAMPPAAQGPLAGSPGAMQGLSPEQRQALGLNLIMPGAGSLLLKDQREQAKGQQWQQPAKNRIDEGIINTIEQTSRLQEIEKSIDPEFLTVRGGLRAEGAKYWEKLMGTGSLDPDTQQYLQRYASFKQQAISNLNAYIKEVTGAQMSEAEAKRLRQGMPDPGDDPLSGDSPSTFTAKLRDKIRMLRLAAARYSYLRSGKWEGGVFTGPADKAPISLDQMQGIMRKRRQDLQQRAKMEAPNNPDAQRQFVIQAMQQEFGI